MQIELHLPNEIPLGLVIVTTLIFVIFGLGGLGYVVMPVEADELVILTPDRWQAAALARQAMAEVEVVQEDLASLHRLMSAENPDPVTAMLLAQRIYANQKNGTSATAAARTALIDASELAARYATGSAARNDVVGMVEKAGRHLDKLLPAEEQRDEASTIPVDPDAALR